MYVYIHMNHVPLVLTGSQTCGLLLLCLWLPMLSARSVFPNTTYIYEPYVPFPPGFFGYIRLEFRAPNGSSRV